MSKTKISEYSSTAADNTDIGGINIAEGMAPSDVNNAMREQMSQLKEFLDGSSGDTITTAKIVATTATILSGASVTGTATFNSAVILSSSVTGTTASFSGATTIGGAAVLSSTLDVTGATTIGGAAVLSSTANITGATTIGGAAVLSSTLAVTGASTFSSTSVFGGTANFQDNSVQRPTLLDYCVKGSALGSVGTLATVDMTSANFFSATLGSATTFAFTNPCTTGDFGAFVLELTNGGSAAVTWPTSVDWPGGTAPTLTAAGVDQLVFSTRNAGTTYLGFVAGLDIK
jgi:hypothetical protein